MPTTHIELTGISCQIAGRILDAGVDQVRHLFADGDVLNYRCIANEWNTTSGSFAFGQASVEPPEWMGFVLVYVFCVLMLLVAFYHLKRRRASPRDVFYWGALAMLVPILGPLVTLVFYRFAAQNNG